MGGALCAVVHRAEVSQGHDEHVHDALQGRAQGVHSATLALRCQGGVGSVENEVGWGNEQNVGISF